MAIIVLVKPRWNYRNISDYQRMFSGKYWLSLATAVESDAEHEYSSFDKDKHFLRLSHARINTKVQTLESQHFELEFSSSKPGQCQFAAE